MKLRTVRRDGRVRLAYTPADHWQPWIGHWFPAIGPRDMAGLTFGQIVGMYEFAKSDSGGE